MSLETLQALNSAQDYADKNSTCCKVKVGSLLINYKRNKFPVFGCNNGVGYNCVKDGCLRVKKYGEDSKNHRLPSDCAALHSEVDAISKAAQMGVNTNEATIYVTRYPCEACARAIIASGIKEVVYGRAEFISPMTAELFRINNITTIHVVEWMREDRNT